MNRFRATAVAVVSTVALGSFAAATVPASFAGGRPAPCSQQTAHVDKATAKTDALAAVFAAHPTKKNKRAEKAQVQRLRRAVVRLASCVTTAPVS
jgi:hypothetical protein